MDSLNADEALHVQCIHEIHSHCGLFCVQTSEAPGLQLMEAVYVLYSVSLHLLNRHFIHFYQSAA